MNTQEALKMIKIYLDGIDKTESEYDDGWWETSNGAEFGKECLTKVLKVVEALESKEIGDAEIKQMLDDIEYYKNRLSKYEEVL